MRYLQGFVIFFFVGLFLALMVGPGDNYYRKKSEKVSFPIEVYLIFGLVGGFVGIGIGSTWDEEDKKKLIIDEENRKRWIIEEEDRKNRLLIQEQIRLEKQKKIENLGLNKLINNEFKDGRKWIFETTWANPSTNQINTIKTFYNKEINSTVTTYNLTIIHNYNSTEGSKVFIEKSHLAFKNYIINKVLDGQLEVI
jgi:hypothetical protein